MLCPKCQAETPATARFCPACGHQFGAGDSAFTADEAPTVTAWPMPPSPSNASGVSRGSQPASQPPSAGVNAGPGATAAPGAAAFVTGATGGATGMSAPGRAGGRQFHSNRPASAASAGMGSGGSSIDDSRFAPGVVIAERYRVVSKLGKGGMGEVYRAEDLKLAQPVALKFLPEHMAFNKTSLERMFNEVRVARTVTHPNVCRVHDVDEIDGVHFLSMEYVDGEDLASLLKRIGRLPQDKGLQLARQICAGLQAAHDRGVLHRDLKPANVMIDGKGSARITDFGLAGVAAELRKHGGRAGTPAYMAPEQFAGLGVSIKSDLYALGLVLYELFVGRPVFRPESMEHLTKLHSEPIPAPSSIVPDIDPRVERAIMRCLERDPQVRPASAVSVAAALPGGDPLADALAAGETPSPEIVAASGGRGSLTMPAAAAILATVIVAVLLVAALNQSAQLVGRAGISKSRDELTFQARQIVEKIGGPSVPFDHASGFVQDEPLVRSLGALEGDAGDLDRLASAAPPAVLYWYRTSDQPLAPSAGNARVTRDAPPVGPGMTNVALDGKGRLVEFVRLQGKTAATEPAPPSPTAGATAAGRTDWNQLLGFAGFLTESGAPVPGLNTAEPGESPPVFCDERAAWLGTYPERPELSVRIEAGGLAGKPVYFEVRPEGVAMTPQRQSSGLGAAAIGALSVVLIYAMPLGIAVFNLKQGRGDRPGALRLAMIVFGAVFLQRVIGMQGTLALRPMFFAVLESVASAAGLAALAWLCYVAIEPIIRRQRPATIVSWSRLLSGKWQDPLVARDLLVGCALGALWPVLTAGVVVLSPRFGMPRPLPLLVDAGTLGGARQAAGVFLGVFFWSFMIPLGIALLEPVVGRFVREKTISLLIRGTVLSVVFLAILGLTVVVPGNRGNPLLLAIALGAGFGCGFIAAKFGLLMLVAAVFSAGVLSKFPVNFAAPSWLMTTAAIAAMIVIAIAAFGFYFSLPKRGATASEGF